MTMLHRLVRNQGAACRRRTVAVMFPQSASARSGLENRLGPDFEVADGRRVDDPDVVLVTPCSVQTMARLRNDHPRAKIIVVDPDRPDLPTQLTGPVHRLLEAGADAYATEPASVVALTRDLVGVGGT
jgi:hypothetical protein